MTTSSSIRVKPSRFTIRRVFSPFLVGPAVDAGRGGQRVHVEHVVALARLFGRAGVAALAPGLGGGERVRGERVARDAAQEVDAVLLRALLVLDPGHQV